MFDHVGIRASDYAAAKRFYETVLAPLGIEQTHSDDTLTEWDDFRWMDFDKVAAVMANRSVVDTRNLLDPTALRRRGFQYDGIGRI